MWHETSIWILVHIPSTVYYFIWIQHRAGSSVYAKDLTVKLSTVSSLPAVQLLLVDFLYEAVVPQKGVDGDDRVVEEVVIDNVSRERHPIRVPGSFPLVKTNPGLQSYFRATLRSFSKAGQTFSFPMYEA